MSESIDASLAAGHVLCSFPVPQNSSVPLKPDVQQAPLEGIILLKERGNCLWLCGSECLLQSCTSEEPGWKTEPLLTGPGKVPDAVCAGVVSSIGSSLVFVCDVAMVFYGRFAAYLTTPIGTQESVEENTDGSRRFRKVPPWSLALVLCPDGIKPAEAETTQPSHTESHLGCPYQQPSYSGGSGGHGHESISCFRCRNVCKGEVVRVQNVHFHVKCFTCQGIER
ncbi:actin-binding LIM protein 3-like isoform X1 [Tachysurus ichikawai]